MGLGYDFVNGLKRSFSPNLRTEEKLQRNYVIPFEDFIDKMKIKGKIFHVEADYGAKKIKVFTEE
jgi:hypothetical protein